MRRPLGVALAALVAVLALSAPAAFGADTTKTLTFPVSGDSTTNIFNETFSCCSIDIGDPLDIHSDINGGIALDMKTTVAAGTHNDLTFTATNLRQGRTLDLTNTFTKDSDSLNVDYTLSGHLSIYGIGFDYNKTEGDTLSCGLPLLDASCSHDKSINLFSFNVIDIGVAYLQANLDALITTTADLHGNGITSHRSLTVDSAGVVPDADLTFSSTPDAKDEGVHLSCALPAGSTVNYAMGDESGAVTGTITEGFGISVHGDAYVRDVPPLPDIHLATIGPFDIPDLFTLSPLAVNTISLGAPAQNVDLGVLQANNIAPTVALDAIPTNGVEGTPIQLKLKGTGPGGSLSPCGDDSLDIVWSFDDGGTAFGKVVNHTFTDNLFGTPPPDRSGKVVVTDPTGLKTTLNFAVPVANVPPTVSAGPDKTTFWGVPVSFHGNGADAGAVDATSLLYSWDFGDPDSPVGGAGQDVSHTYAAPGTRTASVTVKDKDGATGTSSVSVTVTKRGSTTGYTGPTAFVVTDAATLSATLTDNVSSGPVSGRTVSFWDGPTLVATGTTASNGVATATVTFPLGSVGAHVITAVFAGDGLYVGSSSAGIPVTVGRNAAALSYTGTLSSSPSKALTLTGKLVDDQGRPLAGKAVDFTMGAQGCSGTTDGNGDVSCTIPKLNQKPGKYPLAVEFAGDADYEPAAVNGVFTVGK